MHFDAKAWLDRAMGDELYVADEDVDPSDEGVHGGVIDWEGRSSESFVYLHLACPSEH